MSSVINKRTGKIIRNTCYFELQNEVVVTFLISNNPLK